VLGGCSARKQDLLRAEKLQRDGQTEAALSRYLKLFSQVPESQKAAGSLIELRIAECLWKLGRNREAYSTLQHAVEEYPGNTMAHLRLAELLLSGSAPQEAREQAAIVLAHDPQNIEALSIQGSAAASSGDLAEASEIFRRIIALDPSRLSIALALAELQVHQGDLRSARQTLEASAHSQNSDASPLLALGRIDEMTGNAELAERDYRAAIALQDSPQTNISLAQFLARNARFVEAELVMQHAQSTTPSFSTVVPDFDLATGHTAGAISSYRKLLSSEAGGLSEQRSLVVARLIEAELQRSREEVSSGEINAPSLEGARAYLHLYRAALEPPTAEVLEAELALEQGDSAGASAHAQRAISLAPDQPPGHYLLGMALLSTGDPAAAGVAFERALERDPDFRPARQAEAQRLFELGDYKEAEAQIANVIVREPANLQALCLYARVLMAQKRFSDAFRLAQRAHAANRNAAEPHIILADLASRNHQPASALVHYEEALLLEPHSKSAMEGLTRVYRQGRITRTMLAKMERVAANSPPSPELMEIAGRVYAEQGLYRDAERCLTRALGMDPARATAAAALTSVYLARGNGEAAKDAVARLNSSTAHLVAGMRAAQRHDVAAASHSYEEALRAGEHSGVAANNLAWLYAQQGTRLDRALLLASSARNLDPQNPAFLDTLGMVHIKRHEYSQAVEVLSKAVQVAQMHAVPEAARLSEFRGHLKQAYRLAGQSEAAAAVDTPPSTSRR
jgi:tetratricopeptide (TPR) repeat protein